jgi:hypothetical protein
MNTNCVLAGIITLLFLMNGPGLTGMAQAQDIPKGWGDSQGKDMPLLDAQQEKTLDETQKSATTKLFEAADWIDSFFDDGRFLTEGNTTRATIKLSMGYSKNDSFEIKPSLDLRLKLPQLSNRLNLFIEASNGQDFNAGSDPITSRPVHEDSTNSDFTAGLRYFLKESRKYNISFDAGGSWGFLFSGLRYRAALDFSDWQGRFTNRLRYYTDDGLENIATYDLEKQIKANWIFRSTTSVNLYEGVNGIPHFQYFRLYQVLSPFQALSYEAGVYCDTRPSYKMTDTQFIVKYRQRFFRDWLVLEIAPRLTFPEDHDRVANPGIIFQLEAAIGYKADEEGYNQIFR